MQGEIFASLELESEGTPSPNGLQSSVVICTSFFIRPELSGLISSWFCLPLGRAGL